MGNCLVLHDNVIRVMKPDGKFLEYTAPIRVNEVLSEFPGHAISETFPVVQHLCPDANMIGGHLYYLLPLPVLPPEFDKKQLKYSYQRLTEGGVVRIKLVISKKELEMMLRKGVISVDVSQQLQTKNELNKFDEVGNRNCNGWKPVLESIPEFI